MTQTLTFLASYALFILIISLFINGVKIASAGETEVLPDGSEKDSEMILYPLAKFLTQKISRIVYYTSAKEVDKLIDKVNNSGMGLLLVGLHARRDSSRYETIFVTEGRMADLTKVLSMIDTSIMVDQNEVANSVSIYKVVEDYRFSKYIRKPIIQCIICMSSFWGSIAYWGGVMFAFEFSYFLLVLWVPTIFIVSYVNYLIYKQL